MNGVEDTDITVGAPQLSQAEIRAKYGFIVPPGPSVIVVGPDRVGKTTIVSHLSKMLAIPSFKFPSEKEIFKTDGRSSLTFDYGLTHFLSQTGYRFVSDRGHPCEFAFSRCFNRPTDRDLLRRIDTAHAKLGTIVLYVSTENPPIEEDDLVPKSLFDSVKQSYDRFGDWTSCRFVPVMTDDMLEEYSNGRDISERVAHECLIEMGF